MANNNKDNKSGNGRGFAGMDPEKQREAARKGGEASRNNNGGGTQGKGDR